MHELLLKAEASSLREEALEFEIGDSVDVHTRILEGNKERIQVFSGVVIATRGSGTREMFTVRRIVAGEGVERTFPGQLSQNRQAGSRPPRPRPPGEVVLPPRPRRQSDPPGRTPRKETQQ